MWQSNPTESSCLPSFTTTIEVTDVECASSQRFRVYPSNDLHNLIERSSEQVNISAQFLMHTCRIILTWPWKTRSLSPFTQFQRIIFLSLEPLSKRVPLSFLLFMVLPRPLPSPSPFRCKTANTHTEPLCPVSVRRSLCLW